MKMVLTLIICLLAGAAYAEETKQQEINPFEYEFCIAGRQAVYDKIITAELKEKVLRENLPASPETITKL
jgi:hypothetical protein